MKCMVLTHHTDVLTQGQERGGREGRDSPSVGKHVYLFQVKWNGKNRLPSKLAFRSFSLHLSLLDVSISLYLMFVFFYRESGEKLHANATIILAVIVTRILVDTISTGVSFIYLFHNMSTFWEISIIHLFEDFPRERFRKLEPFWK